MNVDDIPIEIVTVESTQAADLVSMEPGGTIFETLASRVSADNGNASKTLQAYLNETTQVWGTPLTATRAVTLSTTGAFNGARFHIIRKPAATGAFDLTIGTGPLVTLGPGQWCDVEYDGTSWVLMGFGNLNPHEVSIKDFGARGDGATDDSTAFLAAMNFLMAGSDYKSNRVLFFPVGNYIIGTDNVLGQWTSSPAYRQHVTFVGAGRYSSRITFKPGGSTAKYLYSGESNGGGSGRTQQLLFFHVEKLGFICDDTGMSAGGTVNLFKQWPTGGAPAQNFTFHDCHYQGATTYPGTVLELLGTQNGSENSFYNCRANGMLHIISSTNPQALNCYVFGCDWESGKGDIYYWAGGGQLTHVGGSIVWSPASSAYILNVDAPAGGITTNFNIYGVKVESNTVNAKIVNAAGTNNTARIAFRDCDFNATAGGNRTSVSVQPNSAVSVLFEKCRLTGGHLFEFKAGTSAYQDATHANGEIICENCTLPRTIHTDVTWNSNALGLFRIRGSQQSTGSATGSAGVAMNCDMTNLGMARPRSSNGAELKSWPGYPTYWPYSGINSDGADSRIQLPPDTMLKSIHVRRAAGGGSGASYRLAVINDDGTYTYGFSTVAAQNANHEYMNAAVWRRLASGVNQMVRIVAVKELAYNTQTGNFAAGRTITGGTSGSTAVIVADTDAGATGTLTLAFDSGAFTGGEIITDGLGGSATAGATTSREGDTAYRMGKDDIFVVEYY